MFLTIIYLPLLFFVPQIIACLSSQRQVTYVQMGNDQYIDDCKLPQIISQSLTSDGVLTQILPEGTSFEIASDYSSVVLKDSVSESTKILNVGGGYSLEISLDHNRLIIMGWSRIDILITWNKQPDCKIESSMSLSCGSSYCNLKCNGIFSCQDLEVEENIWSIKCVQTSSCRGITATCTNGKSCLATCDGTSTCRSGKLYGEWSNVDCTGTSTCRDLTIQTSENVKCTGTSSCRGLKIQSIIESIICWDTSSCRDLNANCADKRSCNLQCDGTSTCRNNKLNGIWNKVECTGTSSCRDLYVEECISSIKCKETSSCRGLRAKCTHGKSCQAKCHGTSTCRNAKLYGSWDLNCSGTSACQSSYVQNLKGSVQMPSSAQTTIVFAIFLSIVLHP